MSDDRPELPLGLEPLPPKKKGRKAKSQKPPLPTPVLPPAEVARSELPPRWKRYLQRSADFLCGVRAAVVWLYEHKGDIKVLVSIGVAVVTVLGSVMYGRVDFGFWFSLERNEPPPKKEAPSKNEEKKGPWDATTRDASGKVVK